MKKAYLNLQGFAVGIVAFLLVSCGSQDFVSPFTLKNVGQVAGIQVANTTTLNQFRVADVTFNQGTKTLDIVFTDAFDLSSIHVASITQPGSVAFVNMAGSKININPTKIIKIHNLKASLELQTCPKGTTFHVEIYGGDNGYTHDPSRPCVLNTVAAPNGPNCMDNDGYLFGVQAQTPGNPHFFSVNSYPQGFTCP